MHVCVEVGGVHLYVCARRGQRLKPGVLVTHSTLSYLIMC